MAKKFRYIGERKNMNGVYGYDFSNHAIVEVKEEFAISKLSGNKSHFEEVKGGSMPATVQQSGKVVETPVVETLDHGVFRLKADDTPYAKPDKVFTSNEAAQTYIDEITDGKKRVIRTKKKA